MYKSDRNSVLAIPFAFVLEWRQKRQLSPKTWKNIRNYSREWLFFFHFTLVINSSNSFYCKKRMKVTETIGCSLSNEKSTTPNNNDKFLGLTIRRTFVLKQLKRLLFLVKQFHCEEKNLPITFIPWKLLSEIISTFTGHNFFSVTINLTNKKA